MRGRLIPLALAGLLATTAPVLAASPPPAAVTAAKPGRDGEVAMQPAARKIIALYSAKEEPRVRASAAHQIAAFPLNWLGLVVEFRDVESGLPPVWQDPEVRGVLAWFQQPGLPDPAGYVAWAERLVASGRRLVVMGDPGLARDRQGGVTDPALVARFYGLLGLDYRGGYSPVTYDSAVDKADPDMVGFERALDPVLPGFELFGLRGAQAHLTVTRKPTGDSSVLVATGPAGGFIAPGFAHHRDPATLAVQWKVNPFGFFQRAFGLGDAPVADVTTLVGRRIYYSHIDGDGWLNMARMKPYSEAGAAAAEVVRDEVIRPFPQMPVTVAPIARELAPGHPGHERVGEIARGLFALPQVEPASHTWSHPFQWNFFEEYSPEKEAPYRGGKSQGQVSEASGDDKEGLRPGYSVPRAYMDQPFDLEREMGGAARLIGSFAPPGKSVRLVQWSGDTVPFVAAVRAAEQAGLLNINGGDSRFDPEFPSVAGLAPVGRRLDGMVRVYASASNENTYTDLWSNRFFGFRDVVKTWTNTESPRRLKPVNLYYHMYSGERAASLKALKDNVAWAAAQELAPVTTTDYAAMAHGFFTTRLVPVAEGAWRVEDRGALQTLRLDRPGVGVDWVRSSGVMGQRLANGSLYVALDPADPAPVVALAAGEGAAAKRPWLVQSRWPLSGLKAVPGGFEVTAKGFGPGEMEWQVPEPGTYRVAAGDWQGTATAGPDGRLSFTVAADATAGQTLVVRRER